MSLVRDIMQEMSGTVNAVLGDLCVYTNKDGSQREIFVVIDKNHEVFSEYNVLAGYQTSATICKCDTEDLLIGNHLTDEDGTTYRIDGLIKETLSKYYVTLVVESVRQ